MKYIIYLLFGFQTLWSQEVSFIVEMSTDTVLMGNYVQLKYSVENIQGDFQAPEFNGFNIISGPNVSSQFSMINGKVTQSASYSYYLQPLEVGVFHIDAAALENDTQHLETATITIVVAANPNGITQDPNNFSSRQEIIIGDPKVMTAQDSMKQKLKKVKIHKI